MLIRAGELSRPRPTSNARCSGNRGRAALTQVAAAGARRDSAAGQWAWPPMYEETLRASVTDWGSRDPVPTPHRIGPNLGRRREIRRCAGPVPGSAGGVQQPLNQPPPLVRSSDAGLALAEGDRRTGRVAARLRPALRGASRSRRPGRDRVAATPRRAGRASTGRSTEARGVPPCDLRLGGQLTVAWQRMVSRPQRPPPNPSGMLLQCPQMGHPGGRMPRALTCRPDRLLIPHLVADCTTSATQSCG